ncbi:MAG: c-type cytochrome [Propylenella sp.]
MRTILFAAALVLTAAPAAAQDPDAIAEGQSIAEEKCARCHAIGPEGESTLPIAPAFRTLSERYPIDDLQEALAEGIVSGHPAMPEFVFEPEEVAALIAYLKSIQPM